MTTEQRIGPPTGAGFPPAAVNASMAGNLRTHRKCHNAARAIPTNSAAVPLKIKLIHIVAWMMAALREEATTRHHS